jgi:hypothetical protein
MTRPPAEWQSSRMRSNTATCAFHDDPEFRRAVEANFSDIPGVGQVALEQAQLALALFSESGVKTKASLDSRRPVA